MACFKDYYYYTTPRIMDPIFWFVFVKLMKGLIVLVDVPLINIFGRSILHGTNRERQSSNEYETSAHLVRVLARGTISIVVNHDKSNFLYVHEKYVHPRIILQNDNIVLKGVNTEYAIFCVSDGVCTLDSTLGPFAFVNTFIGAEKLIFLPLKHFHRLASEIGSPVSNNLSITIIQMTARCGSTLLGTMAIFMFYIFHDPILSLIKNFY